MARRDASSSSRSTSSNRPGTARGARPSRDGKLDIFCPQCGAHYRIAEEALEAKLQCADCKRAFFPKSVVGKKPKAQDHTKVYVGFGAAVVLIVGSLALMSRGGDKPVVRREVATDNKAAQLEIDRKARQDQAMRWARAVSSAELMTLRNYSDMAELAKSLAVDATLVGDARDQAIVAALAKNDATRLFSEMECTGADVPEDAVKAGSGSVTFFFTNKPGDKVYDGKAGAQVTSQWRLDGSQMRLGSFALTMKPVLRGRRDGDAAKTFKPSSEIAKPKAAETTRGGQVVKVTESDPVAIAHLADTPEPLRQKIDKLVQDVIASADPEAPGQQWGRATAELKKIGKPAMPRLINALFELYPDVQGNNQKISQVTRSLLDITGMAFAYDVRGSGDAAKDKPARESVIRQWFAWWWRYANDDYQDAIEKEEDLDAPAKTKSQEPKKPK